MGKLPKDLSAAEWSLMNICWKQGQVSARIIFEESLKEKDRSYHTVKTLLDRMVGKGFLEREKFGPIWLYKATVSRSKMVAQEIDYFVSSVLDNTFAPLFAHLARKENISQDELEALKKLIEEHEERE